MTSPKEKLTKYTAFYRCPDEIRNFKVRVKFKEEEMDNMAAKKQEQWRGKVISWQEKCFSKSERDFYGDSINCVTDLEKRYHERIKEDNEALDESSLVFTYVEEDGYTSEHEVFNNRSTYLQKMVDSVGGSAGDFENSAEDFDFNASLRSSVENQVVRDTFEKMYIMVDLGEYVENIWIKNEQPLCILKFDKSTKVLSVYPDFTTDQPYYIKTQNETVRFFYYFIENCSQTIPEDTAAQEKEIIQKLINYKLSLRKRMVGDRFFLPPKTKLYVFLFFEILSAKNFEYSDVYVHYRIDLPENWSCDDLDSLKGVTQVCHGANDDGLVHFGHCFDVVLEYDLENFQKHGIPKTPCIYFEIMSKASWERYRTEGLTYKSIPVPTPGCHRYDLQCFRFVTQGPSGNLRRFFVGDCQNYDDVTWLGVPKEHDSVVINKFGVNTVGTGELSFRVNVMHQSHAFLSKYSEAQRREKFTYEKLNSSSLIRSVEEVLKAFKKARENMVEAKNNL